MKKKILILAVSLFSFYAVGCAESNIPGLNNENEDRTLVVIEGVVHDEAGNPVADALITVKDNDKVIGEANSDVQGNFRISVEKTFSDSYIIAAEKRLPDGTLEQQLTLSSSNEKANFTGRDTLKKIQVVSRT